jgi:LmbE family N-acetylglucosaminyl deacetylase
MKDIIGKRVMILSPHTDDGELSAGGTIVKFLEMDKEVYYVAFSSCEKSLRELDDKDILKSECIEATNSLGIDRKNVMLLNYEVREYLHCRQNLLDEMIKYQKDISPDLVITSSSFDHHQDHNVIYNEAVRAFKKNASIWGMEHPWNNLSFKTDIFIKLEEIHMAKKIKALKQYGSQAYRDYFNEDFIRACAFTRGMNIGVKYAEVFECIRLML